MSVDRGSKKDRRMAEEANLGRSDSKHNKLHTTVLRGQIQIAEIDRAFPKKHPECHFWQCSTAISGTERERNRRGCETL